MFRIVSIAYLKLKINTFTRQFLFMALWRVLDKTSGSLRSPSSTRHKPTQRNEKARTATKNRGSRAGFPRNPDFFLLPRCLKPMLFHYGVFSFRRCYSHRPFLCRLRSVTLPLLYALCYYFLTLFAPQTAYQCHRIIFCSVV